MSQAHSMPYYSTFHNHTARIAFPIDPVTSLSEADVRKLFSENAYLYVEDPAVGERVKQMRENGFPIESADGLDFCKQSVLDDTRVQHVLHALFPWCGLGIYEVYRTDSNNIYAFMTGLNTELNAIVVQLWSPQSSMLVYGGSQALQIKGFNASNGLLEILYAPLKQCTHIPVEMEKGGLAIFDARLSFKRVKGFAIYFVFATKEELESWPKKRFPGGDNLKGKAAKMESTRIGLNFAFEGGSK